MVLQTMLVALWTCLYGSV